MGTLFSLEVLPAGEGDCLLVHWGPKHSIAVIDGGPATTFERTLGPRLDEIRRRRAAGTLELDLVMVSHVDNDHIVGIRKLFQEMRNDQAGARAENERRFRANRLWHNAFSDIIGEKFDSYYTPKATAALTAVASHGGSETELAQTDLDTVPEDERHHLALVLAGHAEGRTLRDDYKLLHDAGRIQTLNMPFVRGGNPSPLMLMPTPTFTRISELTLLVTGPSESELKKLRADFELFLIKKRLAVPAALVAAASEQDSSPTNLSSVVCLLDFAGKKILLTGDALGQRVLEGLEHAAVMEQGRLHVDVLKVPHHGSSRNVDRRFFERITADTYVISANGKHSNPDREVVEWLIESRGPSGEYEIVFTYPLSQIDATRKKNHERKLAWDTARDGLESLIAAYKQKSYAFSVSNGRKVIDLGDEKLTV